MNRVSGWLRLANRPAHRPSWRKFQSTYGETCRCCARTIWKGWELTGLDTEFPYLCGTCWAAGACVELS